MKIENFKWNRKMKNVQFEKAKKMPDIVRENMIADISSKDYLKMLQEIENNSDNLSDFSFSNL